LGDVGRTLGDRFRDVWRSVRPAARDRDPERTFSVIRHLGEANPKRRLELNEISHDWGTELKELGLVPEPEPEPEPQRAERPARDHGSRFVEQFDDSNGAPRIDTELSDFSHDVFAELRERGIEPEPEPPAQDRGREPGPEREPAVPLHQQIAELAEQGVTLDDLSPELIDRIRREHAERHAQDHDSSIEHFDVSPADDGRAGAEDGNSFRSFDSNRPIRINSPDRNSFDSNSFDSSDSDREPRAPIEFNFSDSDSSDSNREPLSLDSDYLGRYYNLNRDNRALLESIAEDPPSRSPSANTSATYVSNTAPSPTDGRAGAEDGNSANDDTVHTPPGIQIQVPTSTEVTYEPNPRRIMYAHGSNPYSFGGYARDPRVPERQADRQQVAEDRGRDTTPDYSPGL
jgi:hypothetical protein